MAEYNGETNLDRMISDAVAKVAGMTERTFVEREFVIKSREKVVIPPSPAKIKEYLKTLPDGEVRREVFQRLSKERQDMVYVSLEKPSSVEVGFLRAKFSGDIYYDLIDRVVILDAAFACTDGCGDVWQYVKGGSVRLRLDYLSGTEEVQLEFPYDGSEFFIQELETPYSIDNGYTEKSILIGVDMRDWFYADINLYGIFGGIIHSEKKWSGKGSPVLALELDGEREPSLQCQWYDPANWRPFILVEWRNDKFAVSERKIHRDNAMLLFVISEEVDGEIVREWKVPVPLGYEIDALCGDCEEGFYFRYSEYEEDEE